MATSIAACDGAAVVGRTHGQTQTDDDAAAPPPPPMRRDAAVDATVVTSTTSVDAGVDSIPAPARAMCSKPLRERVHVTTIDLGNRGGMCGCADPKQRPQLIVSPAPNGGAHVAFDDADGIVVLSVDAAGAHTGTDRTWHGTRVRGLAVRPDGSDVVLYSSGSGATSSAHVLSVAVLDANGCRHDRKLFGDVSGTNEGDEWLAEDASGTLAARDSGALLAYVVAERRTGGITVRGDRLLPLAIEGTDPKVPAWSFHCAQPADLRLAPDGKAPAALCLSGTPGTLVELDRATALPAATGTTYALGGIVSDGTAMRVAYASSLGRASADVALARIKPTGSTESVLWLTDTPGVTEAAPRLARSGAGWTVGWRADAKRDSAGRLVGGESLVAWVDATGAVDGPVPLRAPAIVSDVDDFATVANGDAAWAVRDGDHRLAFVRIEPCR